MVYVKLFFLGVLGICALPLVAVMALGYVTERAIISFWRCS